MKNKILLMVSAFVLSTVLYCCKNGNTSQIGPKEDIVSSKIPKTLVSEIQNDGKTKSNRHTINTDQDDWYWKNTKMSKNNIFENWEFGQVDLVMVYRYRQNETIPKTLKIGHIDHKGSITINWPETIQTETELGNLQNLVFYDIQDIGKFTYTNAASGYFGKTTLNVEQNGKVIGNLTLGNSVRTTYNLTNQSTLTMGDEGYIISWAYLDEFASLKGIENTANTVRRDGTKPIEVENTVVYDLDFKPGWNLVQTEVIGKYDLEHERGLNASWFKKHIHRVVAEIPEDAAYYFRSN